MTLKPEFKLYLVTDRRRTGGRPLIETIRLALEGGVRAVQLREKDLPIRDYLSLAESLRSLTHTFGARLIINDRVDVCLAVDADGVHLRQDSLPPGVVRKMLGPERLIGYSAHSYYEVMGAEKAGADFAVLGPVFDTPSKRGMGQPIGTEPLVEAAKNAGIPVFAIGGITPRRLGKVKETGVHGIAVISAILEAGEIKHRAHDLVRELEPTSTSGVVPRK
ncbi:MAG TPA: thiamine phosphate synthase [Nitrospiria bacterium]|nr:thiamine phosphate synthase [Nitrospiria bacterium]